MRSVIIMKMEIIKKLEQQIRDNGPSILTGLGVVGLVSTVGLAIKATHDFDKEENKTKKETVKSGVKHFWPVVVVGAGSIACIIGSNKMNMKRNLVLAGALKLSENKITDVKDRWLDSEKKQNEEKCRSNNIIFGDGDIDCYDQLNGRYFKSSISKLHRAIDNVNELLYAEELVELKYFYSFLDMDTPALCEDYIWQLKFEPVKLDLSSMLTEENKPVLVVDFVTRPTKRERY